jgi:hypothetical protein
MKNKIEETYIAYNFAFQHPSLPIRFEAAQTGEGLSFS